MLIGKKRIYLSITLLVFLIVLILVHITSRLSRVEAGICSVAGRVLSEHELKRSMLKNLILTYVVASNAYQEKTGNSWHVGVGADMSPEEIKKRVKTSFNNGISFEENFSIDVIAPSVARWDVGMLDERTSLFIYSNSKRELARILLLANPERVAATENIIKKFKIDSFDKYFGYGNKFYALHRIFISKDCCDNKFHYQSEYDYQADKREAYTWTLENIDKQIDRGVDIISVSNCGEVMARKSEQGMGPSLKFVKWIRWGYPSQ